MIYNHFDLKAIPAFHLTEEHIGHKGSTKSSLFTNYICFLLLLCLGLNRNVEITLLMETLGVKSGK